MHSSKIKIRVVCSSNRIGPALPRHLPDNNCVTKCHCEPHDVTLTLCCVKPALFLFVHHHEHPYFTKKYIYKTYSSAECVFKLK